MKSEDTKRIIRDIAKQEGLSEWAVELIVRSQYEGVYNVIRSGDMDKPETLRGVRLNAFCLFQVNRRIIKRLKGTRRIHRSLADKHQIADHSITEVDMSKQIEKEEKEVVKEKEREKDVI